MINRKYFLSYSPQHEKKMAINPPSQFNTGSIISRQKLLERNNEKVKLEIESWETTDLRQYDFYVCDSGSPSLAANSFSFRGLAEKFARLDKKEEIEDFVNTYGLLGLSHPNPDYSNGQEFWEAIQADAPLLSGFGVGELSVEPLELWYSNIKLMRNLMRIHRLLKKHSCSSNNESILDIFEYKELTHGLYHVFWSNGDKTSIVLSEEDLEHLGDIGVAKRVLIHLLNLFLKDSINIHLETIDSREAPLGFYLTSIPNCTCLINALFYDLKCMLEEDVTVILCKYERCRKPLTVTHRKRLYCDDLCKQKEYRRNLDKRSK